MSEKITWTEEKIRGMEQWRVDNDKTVKEAAEHFGIPAQKYANARFRLLRSTKGADTKSLKPKFIDVAPATTPASSEVVVIKCNVSNLSAVLRQL